MLAPVALALLVDCCLDPMGCLHGGVSTVLPAALAGALSLLGGTCSPLCMHEVSSAHVCGGRVQRSKCVMCVGCCVVSCDTAGKIYHLDLSEGQSP